MRLLGPQVFWRRLLPQRGHLRPWCFEFRRKPPRARTNFVDMDHLRERQRSHHVMKYRLNYDVMPETGR
jgi:hypothetical protein